MIISKHKKSECIESELLNETIRRAGGSGHAGKK
jgi:dUTPase